jgi:membrane fusion protein (multidrug efflux system)
MEETTQPASPDAAPPRNPAPPRNHRRALVLAALATVFILAGVAAGLWWWLDARWYESTDDAYVRGDLVQLTPRIAGTVVRINADDTALVRAGQSVVDLDPDDTQIALAQAKAHLAQTVRRVRQLFADAAAQRADVALRRAELVRAKQDLARRTGLPEGGAVSREDLRHAQAHVQTATAALNAAEQRLAASEAAVSGTTATTHPDVEQAVAQVQAAYLAQQRTSVLAPVTGYVADRTVQVGERVAWGTPLLAIVPLGGVWVDANFKETQLDHVRIGQPVTLTSDLYGGDVTFHGSVVGLEPGTGSSFALLPPQNATGNWIKIVQRLPVRIRIDPHELAAHPLRVGLSMNVTIDTHDRNGPTLAEAPPDGPVASTSAYDGALAAGRELARSVVQANLGAQATPPLASRLLRR